MISVTQEFLDAQNKDSVKYSYSINLFRRYWNSVTSEYLYEVTPIDLKDYTLSRSNISWQLDTEALNVWRVGNVQIGLDNKEGKFNAENTNSFFVDPYTFYKSRVEIKIGYILADGTTETVYEFTGIVVDDPINNFNKRSITVNLSGKEILLSLTSAEEVVQTVTGESIGTGANNAAFRTSNVYTSSITAVYNNDVEVSSSNYTVTDLYDKNKGALITLDTAPTEFEVITADYVHGNSQVVEDEQIGTGSLIAEFETVNTGVGFIDTVYADGTPLVLDVDYSVGDLNEKDLTAKISFPFGVGIGLVLTCDYRHWYKDIAMDTLIGYLLDAAGFPSGDRTIGAISVGDLKKYKVWDTKPEFDAMESVSRNVQATALGDVSLLTEDFVDDVTNYNAVITGSYPSQVAKMPAAAWTEVQYNADALPPASSPAWTKVSNGSGETEEISPAGKLHMVLGTVGQTFFRYSLTPAAPSKALEFSIKLSLTGANANYFATFFAPNIAFYYTGGSWKIANAGGDLDTGITDLVWTDYHNFRASLVTVDDFPLVPLAQRGTYVWMDDVFLGLISVSSGAPMTFGISNSVDPNAETFELLLDFFFADPAATNCMNLISVGVDMGEDTVNAGKVLGTFVEADDAEVAIFSQVGDDPSFAPAIDSWRELSFTNGVANIPMAVGAQRYIRWGAMIITTNIIVTSSQLTRLTMPGHLFDTVDGGANFAEYFEFTSLLQSNNGEIKIYTASSSDDIAYSAEAEVINDIIISTDKRYTQFRSILQHTTDGTSPVLFRETFTYKIAFIAVAMADFTGMFVQDALEEFAKLLDYEIGVGSDGKYFFRARNTNTTVDLVLSDKTNVVGVDSDSTGWSRIFNKITVAVGNFVSMISPTTEGDSEPTSITNYGLRPLEIASSSLEIDDDVDLATNLAEIYYNAYKLPKRKLRCLCRMIPQLELSDTVRFEYAVPAWYWNVGDADRFVGEPETFVFGREDLPDTFEQLVANVVGLELDITNFRLYVSIREI